MSKALEDIAAERLRQIEAHDFDAANDDKYHRAELISAAVNYAGAAAYAVKLGAKSYDEPPPLPNGPGVAWPWHVSWWKPGDVRRMLVKAAALIVAEIERIDRAEEKEG